MRLDRAKCSTNGTLHSMEDHISSTRAPSYLKIQTLRECTTLWVKNFFFLTVRPILGIMLLPLGKEFVQMYHFILDLLNYI